ncbi:MAG: phage portal protein [Paraclostridium sp.]
MGILNKFFNKNPTKTSYKMIQDERNGFYAWDGKLYQSDIIRACIRPKSKAISKLTAKHIVELEDDIKINPEPYIKLLLEEPNPYMCGQMMLEKITTQLELNHNVFIYIYRDENNFPIGLYPIIAVGVDAIYTENGELYLKCTLMNGKIISYPYRDIIHLRKDFNTNDLFGESPERALKPLMEIVNTVDQGIIQAVKNGSVIKWLMMFKQTLKREDIQKEVDYFVGNYLETTKAKGGAIATDPKYELKQVEPKDYVPNSSQMDKTTQRIYSFFNTNEKIVQSKYNEDEWTSYYESEIEPLALQLSNEFTRKLFTRQQRLEGNSIIFESSNLQYASIKTKLDLVAMVDRGALTPNGWLKIMNLPPIEGGDKPIRRLDTATVKEGNVTTNE